VHQYNSILLSTLLNYTYSGAGSSAAAAAADGSAADDASELGT